MIQEISAEEMEHRARVFVSIKTKDMIGAEKILRAEYTHVEKAKDCLQVYDVEDTGIIVEYLLKNGHVVNEIEKNKIGLEEYYIELMSKNGGKH